MHHASLDTIQLNKGCSQTPDVDLLIVMFTLKNHFRRPVLPSYDMACKLASRRLGIVSINTLCLRFLSNNISRHTEVAEFDSSPLAQEHVSRLDISVHDSCRVEEVKTAQ